jgi:hypothetical protein
MLAKPGNVRVSTIRPAIFGWSARYSSAVRGSVPTSSRVIGPSGRTASTSPSNWTRTLSSAALAITRKASSRSEAMAGRGVLASRDQLVRRARALSPRSLAPAGAGSVRDQRQHPGNAAASQGPRAPDRLVSRYRLQLEALIDEVHAVGSDGYQSCNTSSASGSPATCQASRPPRYQ